MRATASMIASAILVGSVDAQCVRDANGDGHPLFFSTYARVDVGYFDGAAQSARATDCGFGDVDADGDVDAIFALAAQGEVEILERTYMTVSLNQGDGVFAASTIHEAGREVAGVALGDFDGDGDLDGAAVNARDDTVSVFLNDGAGVFGEQAVFGVGGFPRSVVARDFDADGRDDLAVLNTESEDVSILLATGGGSFAPEVRVPVGGVTPKGLPNDTFPYPGPFLDAGDVDGDGDVDLAIPCKGVVKILANRGDGSFSLSPEVADVAYFDAYDVVLADLDADGRTDVAAVVTSAPGAVISVVLQNEDGSWADPATYAAGAFGDCPECFHFYNSLAAGDLDNDGDLDLALGEEVHEFVGIYRNNGDGTFAEPEPHFAFDGTGGAWVVELADLNHDGWSDLAFLHYGSRGALHVHINDRAGTPVAPGVYDHTDVMDCQSAPHGISADFDLDGHADLLLAHGGNNCPEQLAVHAGDGAGGFSPAASIPVAPPGEQDVFLISTADVNGDGLPDIVVPVEDLAQELPGSVRVVLNLGGMAFAPVATYELGNARPWWVTFGDFDVDGDVDIAAWTRGLRGDYQVPVDRSIRLLLNLGDGSFEPGPTIFLEQLPYNYGGIVESGDLDGDGAPDLLATTTFTDTPGRLWRLANDGTGGFEVAQVIDVGMQPTTVLARDFDLDGVVEVALMFSHYSGLDPSKHEEPYLVVFENDGTGHLTVTQELTHPSVDSHWIMDAADMDGDGYEDIVMPELPGSVRVHLNQGDGTFDEGFGYDGVGNYAFGAAIADFDEDGRNDVVLTEGDYLTVHLNRACGCAADVNGDGSLDILDFVAFQGLFVAGDRRADCDGDGRLVVALDFACFQGAFLAGCG